MGRRCVGLGLCLALLARGAVSCASPYASAPPEPPPDARAQQEAGVSDASAEAALPLDGQAPSVDAGDASSGATTPSPAPPPASSPAYTHPPVRATPCSASDRDAYAAHQSQSFLEQRAAMVARNAPCAGCVF